MIPLARPRDLAARVPGMISVCLPSRRRPGMLAASVTSLREHAARPDLVEVLVAYDPDDAGTRAAALAVGADVVWQAPERYGYARSAHYYAALIEQASGEWLLPTWGDDGLMQTPGWDEIVRAQEPGTVLWVDGNIAGLTCFPIVHADVLAATGRLCPLPALDSWYEYVGRDAGVLVHPEPPIYVHQDRFDLTGRNDDETYREGRGGYRQEEFFSPGYIEERTLDVAKIQRIRVQ
jgi:hypothetical protein